MPHEPRPREPHSSSSIFIGYFKVLPLPPTMKNSRTSLESSHIPPVPKSSVAQFRMPPAPRSLKKQDLRTEFSIDTGTHADAVVPHIVVKDIEPTRNRSDSILLMTVLFVLSIVACALGAIVFLS